MWLCVSVRIGARAQPTHTSNQHVLIIYLLGLSRPPNTNMTALKDKLLKHVGWKCVLVGCVARAATTNHYQVVNALVITS